MHPEALRSAIDSVAGRMGSVDVELARSLREALSLRRAVETGTYLGETARTLASVFEDVITIELSDELYRDATVALRGLSHVQTRHGHSAELLTEIVRDGLPTLYFLDGHWSGTGTGGIEDECPVLAELAAIGRGDPSDCVIIDDARLFTSAPPPPHDAAKWPHIMEVFDALRAVRPEHLVTLIDDQVIAAPRRARTVIDDYGLHLQRADRGRASTSFATLGRRLTGRLTRS